MPNDHLGVSISDAIELLGDDTVVELLFDPGLDGIEVTDGFWWTLHPESWFQPFLEDEHSE